MALAHIVEVDARRLYVPAGFPSMFLYCVHELHFSEEAARKRIHAARAARRFPAIFSAVAEGRLHLSAVVTLAPHLTEDTADELLAAAHKTRAEIELLLAQRCPRPDVPARLEAISPLPSPTLSIEPGGPGPVGTLTERRAPGRVEAPPKVAPLSPQRYELQLTIAESTRDKLRYAKELLSHRIPSGDLAEVLDRTLDIAIHQLEKSKFAATSRPRRSSRGATGKRHIPAHVRRAVWERDGGQCTFVSPAGQRCPARTFLEFDHRDPVALGGQATVDNTRLLCSSHNQLAAECAFGSEFMANKREGARRARDEARAAAVRRAAEEREQAAAERAKELDVVPWLRKLGFRADEARRAAAHCDSTVPDATLEQRLRAALRFLSPPARRWRPAANGLTPAT